MSRRRSHRGTTLIEVLVAMGVLSLMLGSVWASFSGTIQGMDRVEDVQARYATLRSGLSRMASEISMAYLSFNRPAWETRHFTMFEGRDQMTADSLTFSSFAHIRVRKDANESDQSLIQYFVAQDPKDTSRKHLYRRESSRLTGDLPERLEFYFPAYVLIEDVESFEIKYWESRLFDWLDEWSTIRTDRQPDRLPERVKIRVGVKGDQGTVEYYNLQTILFMQEKFDLSR